MGVVCQLKASVGSTALVEEHRALNDPVRDCF